jgi:hypothetical protein
MDEEEDIQQDNWNSTQDRQIIRYEEYLKNINISRQRSGIPTMRQRV